jgi:hypothetical protein
LLDVSSLGRDAAGEVEPVRTALEWFLAGIMNTNKTPSFIQLTTAMEALLGDPRGKKEITDRLSDRSAYLISTNPLERSRIKKEIEKAYDIRSRIVHTGTVDLKAEDALYWDLLQRYLKNALLQEIDSLSRI